MFIKITASQQTGTADFSTSFGTATSTASQYALITANCGDAVASCTGVGTANLYFGVIIKLSTGNETIKATANISVITPTTFTINWTGNNGANSTYLIWEAY